MTTALLVQGDAATVFVVSHWAWGRAMPALRELFINHYSVALG